MDSSFQPGFLWGAATSSYQIEGSPLADGSGPSIWHRFAHRPGNVTDDAHGDVACDHYRCFAADIDLMRELGLPAYRFSVSWPRVLPEGVGTANPAGLDYYSRLVDKLLENGIQPLVTLFHWDFPEALDQRGGWANADSADWFAQYAQLMIRTLGDRVNMWATLNEPWVVADQGYVQGVMAPGRRDWSEAAAVSRNLLRAHGAAVEMFRAEGDFRVGLVVNLLPIHPASPSPEDRQAAERMHAYYNRQFLDPVLLGTIPAELADVYGANWPWCDEDELRTISQPIDFIGVNYYLRLVVREDATEDRLRAEAVPVPNCQTTAMDWEVYPQGLTEILKWVHDRYGSLPLYVTENGAAFDDQVLPNGAVDDPLRVQFLRDHLLAAKQAIDLGVDLRGYFAWSLLDNFEWHHGFSKRFGLVHVDYNTQRRTPKSSARFYSRVIRSNGKELESD
jgi:beta-glucosidase